MAEDDIGYCQPCLQRQLGERDRLEASSPDWLHEYAEYRREEIQRFFDRNTVEHIDWEMVPEYLEGNITVFAILSPLFAASLDYSLIKKVARIEPVSDWDRNWLEDYWKRKYEIDLPDFDHKVGLKFETGDPEDYYNYSYDVYDYPSSLVQTYCIVTRGRYAPRKQIELRGEFEQDHPKMLLVVSTKRSSRTHLVRTMGYDIKSVCGKTFSGAFNPQVRSTPITRYAQIESCCLDLVEVVEVGRADK